jgi:tRNA modification GTPase
VINTPRTIFALATPPGKAGLAVMRISGPDATMALSALSHAKAFLPRVASLCKLYAKNDTDPFDEALVLWFEGPASFTGEDVVELHLHGGRAIVEAASQALLGLGIAPAGPGEFTRRAFENNKLYLVQAEAIADLIDAQTQGQRKQAQRQLEGHLGTLYQGWREALSTIRAQIEACIDFPEEEDVINDALNALFPKVDALLGQIKHHLQDNHRGERVREGFKIALIGPVNAGKSTLLNRLSGEDAAIVSDKPGTTRDVVRVQLDLGGFLVELADTAGLRKTTQAIELEGIKRTNKAAEAADLRLFVLDASQTINAGKIDARLAKPGDMLALNKADLLGDKPFSPTDDLPDGVKSFVLSAKQGIGTDALLAAIEQRVVNVLGNQDSPSLTRARHRQALEQTGNALERAVAVLQNAPELAGEHLREASAALGEITGEDGTEDILGKIFSAFCIGK